MLENSIDNISALSNSCAKIAWSSS